MAPVASPLMGKRLPVTCERLPTGVRKMGGRVLTGAGHRRSNDGGKLLAGPRGATGQGESARARGNATANDGGSLSDKETGHIEETPAEPSKSGSNDTIQVKSDKSLLMQVQIAVDIRLLMGAGYGQSYQIDRPWSLCRGCNPPRDLLPGCASQRTRRTLRGPQSICSENLPCPLGIDAR